MSTILLIENDPHQRALCVEELCDAGFQVFCAPTIRDVLQMMAINGVDGIVVGLRFAPPGCRCGLDGNTRDADDENEEFVLVRRLCGLWPRLPVILYTTHTPLQDFAPCGASACLLKQSDLSELISTLHKLFSGTDGGPRHLDE